MDVIYNGWYAIKPNQTKPNQNQNQNHLYLFILFFL